MKQLVVPPMLLSKVSKTEVVEAASPTFSENNMYAAYIHYCNLQNEVPVPDDLEPICQEKILGLKTMNLEQAINVLEDNGKKQTAITLTKLMSVIAYRNLVHIPEDEQPLVFTDIEPSENQDLVVSHILSALLNKEKIEDLDHYLKHLNHKMLENIKEYLNLFGRDLSRGVKTKIANHLEKIHETPNLATFIKNSLYYVSIMNGGDSTNNMAMLFDELRRDPIVKDISFLVSQLMTIRGLDVQNIYKYCYLSLFSQIISESKDDKYVKYKIEDLFDGNEVDFVDDRQEFYNDVCSVLRKIIERDMDEIQFMSQKYVAPVVLRCQDKGNSPFDSMLLYSDSDADSDSDFE